MRFPMVLALLGAAACGGGAATKTAAAPSSAPAPVQAADPLEHALSGLAAQHVVVLPTYGVRIVPGLDWAAAVGPLTDVRRTLDADIVAALEEHGLQRTWIFPDQLAQSYRLNSSYATDPYALAEEPLRAPRLGAGDRLPEPLASELRTLIALHDDTRLVLAPVDFRFERSGTGGRGVLRLVVIDPRFSSVSWVGEISSDAFPAFTPAISAGIASRLANVVAAP